MSNTYQPFLRPLAVNGFAVIIATGKAGRISGKARWDGRTVWGIDWASEYPSSELCRLTPAQYHALPESHKTSKANWGEQIHAPVAEPTHGERSTALLGAFLDTFTNRRS